MNASPALLFLGVFTATLCAAEPLRHASDDWPWWRGPTRDGKAASDQQSPTAWSATENIRWKCPLPGRGHGSPTLIGDRIYLATSDPAKQTQSVVAVGRDTGKLLWEKAVNTGNLPAKIHPKNTHASATVCGDGHRVFTAFYNNDAIQITALDPDGKILWDHREGPFIPRKYEFGYGVSPILHGDHVIVAADWEKGGFIIALDRATGKPGWRIQRAKDLSFSTPVIASVNGREQLLISGGRKVMAYDPADGRVLWSADAGPNATCGTLVCQDDFVFASGGYPQRMTLAVKAGTGEIVWQNTRKSYEQSMLAHDGYLYAHTDSGVAYCWRATDGKEMWSARLSSPVSASPVLVGDRIYATDEKGTTWIFKASPEAFVKLGENQLGNHSFATPAFVDQRIYTRVGFREGGAVREMLYCIGR